MGRQRDVRWGICNLLQIDETKPASEIDNYYSLTIEREMASFTNCFGWIWPEYSDHTASIIILIIISIDDIANCKINSRLSLTGTFVLHANKMKWITLFLHHITIRCVHRERNRFNSHVIGFFIEVIRSSCECSLRIFTVFRENTTWKNHWKTSHEIKKTNSFVI